MGWHKWVAVWLEEATETSPIEKNKNKKKSVDIIYYYDQQEMSEDESVLICLYIFFTCTFFNSVSNLDSIKSIFYVVWQLSHICCRSDILS